jgi:predicted lactoylglutathione lyase
MRMIFVNLPVKDLPASQEFFGRLGFTFNPEFSDDQCGCMIVDQNIYVMLLTENRFKDFVVGEISDATKATEVLLCLTTDSRQQVDDMVATAVAAGGNAWQPPIEDGPMYGGSFQDLDGHVWEIMHMAL